MHAQSLGGTSAKMRILQAAGDLFHKQGIRATSPEQIIKASGTGKGQFYHYFKNKNLLVHAVLQSCLKAVRTGTTPISYDIASWEDLRNFFVSHIEFQRQYAMTRSCPIGAIGHEVNEEDELIRQDVGLILEVMKGKLAAFFIREKAKGRFSQDAKPEVVADFCIAIIQGAMLLGKVNRSRMPADAAVEEALLHLKFYAPKSRHSLARKMTA